MRSNAGIVVYRREGKIFEGQWSHEDTEGVLLREVAHDVAYGVVEGDWPVDIYIAGCALFYKGTLKSVRLGDSLKLTWTGKYQAGENAGKPGSFVGIGIALDPDLIVASFEKIKVTEKE